MSAAVLLWRVLLGISILGFGSSTIFLVMVLVASWSFKREMRIYKAAAATTPESSLPFVSVFKPVHGSEPKLADNLASFFQQNYPDFEIIIGARDAANPAVAIAESVRRQFPNVKSRIVFSGPPTWPNAKVFSLANMIPLSSADYFVTSDSDVVVGKDFLRNVIPLLLERKIEGRQIGLVTCPYRGVSTGDFFSSLEALGMSVEMPSGVVVANMLEGIRFALGPAIALRRDALEKIGGIAVTADFYSDDYELGHKVWASGYKVVFSHEIIGHVLTPRSMERAIGDQLRWMKSTRYSRPLGHIGSGLTYAMPFGVLGFVAAFALGHAKLGIGLFAAAFLNRVVQSIAVGWGVIGDPRALYSCWLYPLRDFLGFFIWAGSFTGRNFYWRGEMYRFSKGGRICAGR